MSVLRECVMWLCYVSVLCECALWVCYVSVLHKCVMWVCCMNVLRECVTRIYMWACYVSEIRGHIYDNILHVHKSRELVMLVCYESVTWVCCNKVLQLRFMWACYVSVLCRFVTYCLFELVTWALYVGLLHSCVTCVCYVLWVYVTCE